jgi:dynein heavy chain
MNICRGLFESHKLLYSFLNTVRITSAEGKITPKEWAYYLTGASDEAVVEEFGVEGIHMPKKVWRDICGLPTVHANFAGIDDSFK